MEEDYTTSTDSAPQRRKRNPLPYIALGCVGMCAILVLPIAGWFFFDMWQANQLMAEAREQRAAGDYGAAVTTLERVINEYESFTEADEAAATLPQVRFEWAEALREAGEYEEALERYAEVDDPALAEQADAAILETRLEWGDALVESEAFGAALEQYEAVLAITTPEAPQAEQARAALPMVYVPLAREALQNGDVELAFERIAFVLDNYQTGPGREAASALVAENAEPLYAYAQQQRRADSYGEAERVLVALINHAEGTPQAEQARTDLPPLYMDWGAALTAAGEHAEAVGVYKFFIENFPESELVPQAETALIDAQVAAVAASGEAGTLPPPQAAAESGGEQAAYDVANDTVCPIVVLLSGPQSQQLALAANGNTQVDVEAGTYQLLVQVDEEQPISAACEDIIPFTGEYTFESGIIYSSSFYIETVSE
jgi:tetratricopeptide (TPR) repeat protein